ncbi:MAG: LuxR C-terminal-related transcriptional regulator [Propionibacteriaceae bacterium]|nr:LuxR C-terminal-related transcriptional regulator [Propionibacteriaceae bacterium]
MNQALQGATNSATGTTTRRELIGWCGGLTWLLLMEGAWETFAPAGMSYQQDVFTESVFMLVTAVTIVVLAIRYGKNLPGLSRVAFFTAPFAPFALVGAHYLPTETGILAYCLSGMLIAPVVARRACGVLSTGSKHYRLTRYMAGWTCAAIIGAAWPIVSPPPLIGLLAQVTLVLIAWLGVRRDLTGWKQVSEPKTIRFSPAAWLVALATLVVLSCLIWFRDLMLYTLFIGTDETWSGMAVDYIIALVPSGIGWLLFAILSDKGHERAAFMIGMGLFLVTLVALVAAPGNYQAMDLPLTIVITTGGVYSWYFVYSFPMHFIEGSRWPAFFAMAGVPLFLSFKGFGAMIPVPQPFGHLGIPVMVGAAISGIVFVVVVSFLYEHYKERSLGAMLNLMIWEKPSTDQDEPAPGTESVEADEAVEAGEAGEAGDLPARITRTPPASPGGMGDLLTAAEIEVALLLMEGQTKYAMSRKLHQPVATINQQMEAIRVKVIRRGDPDPGISVAVHEFGLTRRETDVLRCVCRSMTSRQIAEELVITEDTVKKHLRSLMAKLPVADRKDVPEYIDSLGRG